MVSPRRSTPVGEHAGVHVLYVITFIAVTRVAASPRCGLWNSSKQLGSIPAPYCSATK